MILTAEQSAIIDFVRAGKGDLLIEALAGSAKTTTLIESLKVIPQRSILMCAFNKGIAESLKAKLPNMPKTHVVHVKTFHAMGLSIIQAHYPKLKVDKNASETLIKRAIAARSESVRFAYPIRRAALKLLRTFKETEVSDGIGFADSVEILKIGHVYNVFGKLKPFDIEQVCDLVGHAYQIGMRPRELEAIDFCDMIWMPIALKLKCPSRYQAILVDEWQDLSQPQFELIRKLQAPNGRLIMAGDFGQAIYDWRGADGAAVRKSFFSEDSTRAPEYRAKTLTLTTSFRCSQAVITEAQELVPQIKPWVEAYKGSVTHIMLTDMPRMMMSQQSDDIHTFVLSRNNAALLDCALFLWREGVRFQLNAGESLLEPLFDLLEQLDLSNTDSFRKSLNSWHEAESKKADAIGATAWKERIDEQRLMLLQTIKHVKPFEIKGLLSSILKPGNTGVLLSTVHKVKGLEADRVFLLRETFARHAINPKSKIEDQYAELFKAPSQEDLNIEYVAITRAREHLIWVTSKGTQ